MNDDLYEMDDDVTPTIGGLNSCIFGVKSVSIVLYTSNIPNGKVIGMNESCNLLDSSKPVFFMTHGFLANSHNYNFSDLANEMLKRDYTVFSIDWSNGSCYNDPAILNLLEYPFAVYNVREVGDYLANFIKSAIDVCHVPLSNITLMGHSLGSHISGFAAKQLQNLNYGKVPLLIGTDPASPLFELRTCTNRLCKSDAERVIVLHSSALGLQVSLGHLDLWFNNGFRQPACGGSIIGGLNVNCSHNIAIVYLITLLDNYEYVGVPVASRKIPLPNVIFGCSSDTTNCIVVDNKIIDRSSSTVGDYCVFVTSEYPYCTRKDVSCFKNMLLNLTL